MRLFSYPSNTLSARSHDSIGDFCQPYFRQLGLNYFQYFRYYSDGHIFQLMHDTCLDDYYWSNTDSCTLPNSFLTATPNEAQIFIWRESDAGHMIQDLRDHLGLGDPVGIYYVREGYLEMFIFASPTESTGNGFKYLTQFSELKAMSMDFVQLFDSMIQQAHQERVLAPNIQPNPLFEIKPLNVEIQGELGPVILSAKEFEVADKLVKGFSVSEIADELYRSPRTVETHVDSIKAKIGVRKKPEMIRFLLNELYHLDLRRDRISL